MSTFGFVPDLLDERYLGRVRDVVGNVEPMPKLVPYDEYKQAVIVYRMDSEHDKFLFQIQEYTKLMSELLGKELWTYYVQWEVDNSNNVPIPTPKKPRLQIPQHEPPAPEDQTPRRKPIIDQVDRAIIDPELIQEEEMLRVLINIVQVESSMVPNVVEWLYRWIDYLEGDGKALKAALKWEIPSLWDFDHHPLVVSGEMKRRLEEMNTEMSQEKDAIKANVQDGNGTALNKARELVQGSPTKKMREKPSLAALEQKIEDNERLKYREVRYGIRLPKDERPLPPLFNIPLDEDKRKKYYDACYRSRHRALVLLLEAGISLQQISSYVKKQGVHPRDTPVNETDKELIGLKHYRKDAEAGQDYFKLRATQQIRTLKQTEIAMSDELALEGQQATRASVAPPRSYVTDVPHAPVYVPQNVVAESLWSKIQAAKAKNVDITNYVPTPLVGGMRSAYLELARDRREMKTPVMSDYRSRGPQPDLNYVPHYTSDPEGDSEEDDIDADESEEGGDDDGDDDDEMDDGSGDNLIPSSTHSASAPTLNHPSAPPSATLSSVQPVHFPPFPAPVGQTHPNGPLTDERREELRHMLAIITAPTRAPAASHSTSGTSNQAYSSMAPANMNQTNHFVPSHQTPRPATTSMLAGGAGSPQAPRTSMPCQPPVLTRPTLRPIVPEPQRPTMPGQSPHARPLDSIAPPASGPGRWTMEHFQINSRARPPPHPAPINPPPGFAPSEVRYHNSNYPNTNPQPPQVSRPSQAMVSKPPVLGFPPLPGRSNEYPPVNMNSVNNPQAGLQHNHPGQFHSQQACSPLPAQGLGETLSMNNFPASQRPQQTQTRTQTQAAQQRHSNPVQVPNQYAPPVMQPPRLQTPVMQSQGRQPPTTQPPRQQFPGMQPPRLQFPNTQNNSQNVHPAPSWLAAPSNTVPTMAMTTPSFTPPQQPNQQHPNAQASRARAMLQAATRPTIPVPMPHSTPHSNTGRVPYFPDPRAMNQFTTPGIQRNAPAPLTLQPSTPTPGPLTSLAESIFATTPFRSTARGTPIQIYFPKIVVPGNGIGPGGTKLGDDYHIETDALMLGHTIPGSGEITLERALFMPLGCWTNTVKRVRASHADVLESYPSSFGYNGINLGEPKPCHLAAYTKLSQALSFMVSAPKAREELLTKRWRVTPGPLTQIDRGAVWEGWGVSIGRPIGMTRAEREGVMRMKWVIDDGSERVRSVEEEEKWKEMEDFMDEEGEGWDFEDDDEMEE
ncbi:hypothetical protein HBI04_109160 [Parastagonospora nodorum]|nr:hypothetical protein HBI03_140260 [Parastagonospora nodorum]KAH4276471.1 hypothetical protein HBI04_109160 [Parastagonospora nodorum]KAH5320189.1 hypothetical protein HBI50_112410 [Parastagonospora nodorum]